MEGNVRRVVTAFKDGRHEHWHALGSALTPHGWWQVAERRLRVSRFRHTLSGKPLTWDVALAAAKAPTRHLPGYLGFESKDSYGLRTPFRIEALLVRPDALLVKANPWKVRPRRSRDMRQGSQQPEPESRTCLDLLGV